MKISQPPGVGLSIFLTLLTKDKTWMKKLAGKEYTDELVFLATTQTLRLDIVCGQGMTQGFTHNLKNDGTIETHTLPEPGEMAHFLKETATTINRTQRPAPKKGTSVFRRSSHRTTAKVSTMNAVLQTTPGEATALGTAMTLSSACDVL